MFFRYVSINRSCRITATPVYNSDTVEISGFILRWQPALLLTSIDYQQHISGLGNIWETFRACTAHSASMCQSINFYSLLLSFLFFRVNTYRFTCILARSANFACKINE